MSESEAVACRTTIVCPGRQSSNMKQRCWAAGAMGREKPAAAKAFQKMQANVPPLEPGTSPSAAGSLMLATCQQPPYQYSVVSEPSSFS